jgi:hypothetical protein
MGKYQPLTAFLNTSQQTRVQMTFSQLEGLLGFPLPPSARKHRSWWSNNPNNNVATRAWVDAGYGTADVELAGQGLAFVKLGAEFVLPEQGFSEAQTGFENKPRRHPLFGALKGLITIEEGYDLTLPADPDWGDVYK